MKVRCESDRHRKVASKVGDGHLLRFFEMDEWRKAKRFFCADLSAVCLAEGASAFGGEKSEWRRRSRISGANLVSFF